jgi:hypothetical protein
LILGYGGPAGCRPPTTDTAGKETSAMQQQPTTPERWRPVPGFEGFYDVSDHGRMRSVDRNIPRGGSFMRRRGREMRQRIDQKGYARVYLSKGGVGRRHRVHRLVLAAFIGPCPDGHEAAHQNGVRADNRLENLRWSTPAENAADRDRHGSTARGSENGRAKLNASKVRAIRLLLACDQTMPQIAEQFGVAPGTIEAVKTGRTWRHVA